MRSATMDRQATTDCGGWRAGHNGSGAARRHSSGGYGSYFSNHCANNTQIAAPQRTTNQTNESQTSRSSRFMICQMMLVWPRTAVLGGADALTEHPHPTLAIARQ